MHQSGHRYTNRDNKKEYVLESSRGDDIDRRIKTRSHIIAMRWCEIKIRAGFSVYVYAEGKYYRAVLDGRCVVFFPID